MGVFPIVDNLLHVMEGVKQEVIAPFVPVNGHSAISVHTGRNKIRCHIWLQSFKNMTQHLFTQRPCVVEQDGGGLELRLALTA